MLYDAYVAKMKRLVKLRNWIIKHRFILLTITLIILAGTISFLASIGSITIVNDCKEEIVYGEKNKFQASAFLKDVSYEYRGDGMRQWSTELPIYPGEYEIRAVSKGFFGNPIYSQSQEFKILPKQVTLSINSRYVQYGDDISLSGQLVSGDKAYIEGLTSSLTNLTTLNIKENQEVKIYNSNNKNVTSCYEYTIVPSSVGVTKRTLKIAVESISKDYDGSPLKSGEYDITEGSIVKTDKLNISFDKSITTVGTVDNTPTVVIYNSNNVDVTKLYNIVYQPKGTLKVNQKHIKIETASQSFEYDATVHSNLNYELKTSLPQGHTIKVISGSQITNVGTIDNTLSLEIRNSSGVDVTACYNIEFTKGKLEVTKRKISIQTGSATYTYNGIVQSCLDYNITSSNNLCAGDTLTPISKVTGINVGSYSNELSFTVRNQYGDEITNNYDITTTYGTITINKLAITVETGSTQLVYNGTPQSYLDFTVISSNKIPEVDTAGVDTFTEITNVGQIENVLTLKISNNKFENVTNNYEITYVNGYIEITKRPVTIVTSSSTHVYDDTDYKDESYSVSSSLDIVESHQTEVIGAPTIKYVGTISNRYEIIIKDSNGIDCTSNYELSYVYGTLEVTKRPLTITTDTIEHIYDATIFKDVERNMITKTDLNHDITYKNNVYNEIKNVGEIDNICEVLDIVDSTNSSVLRNYEITYNFGKLIVNPRPIVITTGSSEKVYDGTPLVYATATEENLVRGHVVTYDNWTEITNVGVVDNNFGSYYIYEGITDVTNNYTITVVCGTLTITPRLVTIQSISNEKIYDGTPLFERNYNIISGSLANGEELKITDSTSFIDCDVRTNEILSTKVEKYNGIETTSNYIITYQNDGTLEILKRELVITTNSNQWIYDGQEKYDTGYSVNKGSLVSGELLVPMTYPTVKFVGSYSNSIFYGIVKADGSDSSNNYNLTVNYGVLNIVKREITVKPVDLEKEYDDIDLAPYDYECISELTIPTDHRVEVTYSGSIKNVGVAKSYITGINIYQGEVDVTNQFDITKVEGTLTITPRIIETTPQTITHVYNGKAQDNSTAEFDGKVRVVEGHTYQTYLELVSLTDVGSTEFDYYITNIYNALGDDVTSNYTITSNRGTLEIVPRVIYVFTKDFTKEYDGQYITSLDIELIRTLDLVDGHKYNPKDNYTRVKNIGSYQNFLEIESIVDSTNGNRDVTHNYEIIYRYGTITITPRVITFQTASDSKVYDGTPLSNSEYSIINGSIAPGEILEVLGSTEVIEYTKGVPNELVISITNSLGEDTLPNYLIQYEHGYLSIAKREINIKTGSITEVYTSNDYSNDEFTYDENELVSTDRIEIATLPTYRYVGKYNNEIIFKFYNEDERNVSHCYNVIADYGTVDISVRYITITTGSAQKKYDGEEFFCKEFTTESNYEEPNNYGIGPNDKGEITNFTTVINPGIYSNELKIKIVNEENKDVTYCYAIDYILGTLTIIDDPYNPADPDAVIVFDSTAKRTIYEGYQVWEENDITVTITGNCSYSRDYYGNYYIYPSSNSEVTVNYPEGIKHIVISSPYNLELSSNVDIEGAKVERFSRYTEIVFDETVEEFTFTGYQFAAYKMSIYKGEEDIVVPNPIDPKDPVVDPPDGGVIKKPGDGDTESEPVLVFKFTTDYQGYVYFRQASFGDYNEGGFDDAIQFDFSDYDLNPLYLLSAALDASGNDVKQMEISVLVQELLYALPYYSVSYRDDQTDSYLDFIKTGDYYLDFIPMDSVDYNISTNKYYTTLETVYRQFVYENYLQIPVGTKTTLDNVISANGLDKNSPTIIYDVQSFLRNFGKYNLQFAEYPEGCDMVAYFFEEAKEGICQHYAMAGTMLFRALGIPARYTLGYAIESNYGKETYVYSSAGHAWVEIYIDGLGWLPVEVTGTNTEEPEIPEKIPLTIKPIDRVKEYDGIILYPYTVDDIGKNGIYQIIEGVDAENSQLFEKLLSEGYTYYVEISGEQKEIGVSPSNIDKIIIYDPDGQDVTEYFELTFEPGKLEVVSNLVTIYAYNYTKYYDGSPLNAFKESVYKIEGLNNNYVLTYDLVGSITNVGSIEYTLENIVLLNEKGENITDQYTFKVIGKLVVAPRKITVSSGSAIKGYDEEPLTNSSYFISIGTLVDGHKIDAKTSGEITNPGEVDNEFEYIIIKDKNNVDVTNNYTIKESYGTLVII